MKKFYRFLGASLTIAASLFATSASADALFSYDFTDSSTFSTDFRVNDLTGFVNTSSYFYPTWQSYSYKTSTPAYYYARCYDYQKSSYDDYMTTQQAVALSPGHVYRLSYDFWDDGNDSGKAAILEIGYGTGEDESAYTMFEEKTGVYINKYNSQIPAHFEELFEVQESGNYYFTFHSKGTGGMGVRNIVLEDYGLPGTPAAPTALTVTPAEDFSLKATVQVTLPTLSTTGGALESISELRIYRNSELATTITEGLTPGAVISWEDNNAPEGNVEYSAIAVVGELVGNSISASAFVGPLEPMAPTAVTLTNGGNGNLTLSWTAPTQSINGIDLNAEMLKYNVFRVVNNEEAAVATATSETSFSEIFTPEERTSVSYNVVAIYGTKSSAAVASNSVKIGTAVLPFSDSFAGGVLSDDWEITSNGSYKWNVVTTGSSPSCSPQDGDGGMLKYESYYSSTGNTSLIYTPEINSSSATNATIHFYMYQASSYKEDKVSIQVSKDGAGWVDVANSEITNNNSVAGWTEVTVPFQSYIEGSETFRVGLLATSSCGYNIYVDNVSVYNTLDHDMLISSLSAPSEVKAGNDATIKVTAINKGCNDLEAGAYSVTLKLNDEIIGMSQSLETAANQSVEYEYLLPTDATYISTLPYTLSAEITYADDEDNSNNTATAEMKISGSANPRVTTLSADMVDNSILLSWEKPIDTDGITMTDIKENFANCSNVDGALTGTDWTVVNNDTNAAGSASFGFSSDTWIIFSSTNMYAPTSNDGGQFIAMTSSYNGCDDWFISPALNPFDGGSYKVKLAAIANSNNTPLDVCYSDTDMELTSFTVAGTVTIENSYSAQNNKNWYTFEVSVPSTAKYIAIRNTAGSSRMTAIDYVSVKSDVAVINGYNVYEDGARINDEMITDTSYSIPVNAQAREEMSKSYQVSTVYDDAESELSDPVSIIISGVKDLNNGAYGVTLVKGGIITDSAADIYSLDGKRIASTRSNGKISLSNGVYIVRCNGKAVKVVVR
jgi:hypothetical protein